MSKNIISKKYLQGHMEPGICQFDTLQDGWMAGSSWWYSQKTSQFPAKAWARAGADLCKKCQKYSIRKYQKISKQEQLKSNIKLRVCVVKKMCGKEYVWTAQHTDKVKCPKIRLRVYSTLLTSFVSSCMLKSLCLSLFDNFDIFLTDRPTTRP